MQRAERERERERERESLQLHQPKPDTAEANTLNTWLVNNTAQTGCWFLHTWRSFTRDQELTNSSLRRVTTGELSRGPSRRVRPEPQQDWSSSAPHSRMWCTGLFSSRALSKASVKERYGICMHRQTRPRQGHNPFR